MLTDVEILFGVVPDMLDPGAPIKQSGRMRYNEGFDLFWWLR